MIPAQLLSLVLTAGGHSVVSLSLKPAVSIDTAYPVLGDIAVISDDAGQRVAGEGSSHGDEYVRLSEIPVGGPLLPGRNYRFGRAEVQYYLRQSGLEVPAIKWDGAARVTISREQKELKKSLLQNRVRGVIATKFGIPLESLELSLSAPPEISVPGDEYDLDIQIEQPELHKSMSALVSISSAGRLIRKQRVKFTVSFWKLAMTAATDIRSNTEISHRLVARDTVDVLSARGKVASSLTELAGKRLVRPVRAGQPIALQDVEPVPAVIKSREVQVIYASGMISIKMKGLALEDGIVGETVMVAIPTSDTPVTMKVTGEKQGRIENGV